MLTASKAAHSPAICCAMVSVPLTDDAVRQYLTGLGAATPAAVDAAAARLLSGGQPS